jgi:hypothetical protein
MTNLLDLAMLICASLAALAFGIFAGFWVLRGAFALMGRERRQLAVKPQPEAAHIS